MALRIRKLIVVGVIAAVILLANALVVAGWLDDLGLVASAGHLRTEYVTGTAIAVIVALLVLLPSATAARGRPRRERFLRCPVCDEGLRPGGRYCPACGSRV